MNEIRKVKVTAKRNASKRTKTRIFEKGMFGFWVREFSNGKHIGGEEGVEKILLREVRVDQLNDGTWIDLPARGGWLGWFPLDEIDVVDIRWIIFTINPLTYLRITLILLLCWLTKHNP